MFVWFFPPGEEPDELRLSRIAIYLGALVEWLVANNSCHVAVDDGRIVGAALWKQPGGPLIDTLPTAGAASRLLMPAERAEVSAAAFRQAREQMPPAEGAYLWLLAVDPELTGQGIGRLLMDAAAESYPGPRWVETTNPANHAFYERCGYRAVGSAALGGQWSQPDAFRQLTAVPGLSRGRSPGWSRVVTFPAAAPGHGPLRRP